MGKISINLYHYIDKIFFVEGLNHNLLSISQLCDIGYSVSFNKVSVSSSVSKGKTN